jgi:hypothetical protein
VILAFFQVAKSPNLEQSGVQMDGELPTLAADNHIEQVTGAVPTTNPRGVRLLETFVVEETWNPV